MNPGIVGALLCLSVCMSASPLRAAEDDAIVLRSTGSQGGAAEWSMQRRDRVPWGGDRISARDFDAAGWQRAIVPGTVLNSLVANGVHPEPYFGLNNAVRMQKIPDLNDWGREIYTYWFRTSFELNAAFEGKRVLLQFDGINYRAEIWLNGTRLGDMAGMFRRAEFDVTDLVSRKGRNVLAVLVVPPDVAGGRVPKKGREGALGENSNGGDHTFGQNVTMLMSVGWDFTAMDGIRDRNTGIWDDVRLVPCGPVAIRHVFARSKMPLPELAPAAVTVSAEAVNLTKEPRKGVLRARIPEAGVAIEQPVELKPGEKLEVVFAPAVFPALVVKEPKLWWPLNKGPQNLYACEVEFVEGGVVTDAAKTRFGIREITSDTNTPDKSRLFYVNGKRLFVRGSNWIPEAMCRTSDTRTRAELRWTAQSGVNMLRLWGGGITESDLFYDLCDELGILVWTEFWQTGDTDLPADADLYRANVVDTVKRIRNHASQAYWVSANERSAEKIIPIDDLLAKLDGTRGYQPGSETDGIHDGSPYWSVNPMWYYENTGSERGSRIDGFNPEYGCPCLPTIDAVREMMDERDFFPMNKAVWDYLDGGGFHRMSTSYTDGMNQYGPSATAEELAMRGQAYGALANRALWECWSRNKLDYGDRFASGFLFWYHNSPLRQICARMWDWSLEPTAALYYTQKANEPLHAQFDFLKDGVSVVNEWPREFKGTVSLRVLDFDLKELLRRETPVMLAADAVTNDVIRVEWPAGLTPVHFLKLELRDAGGKLVSDNFYWRSTKPYQPKRTWTGPQYEGFESLAKLPQVALETKVTEGRNGAMATRTATVKNPSASLAFLVWLRLQHADTGKPVRPAFATDNFFCLLPGEEKAVTIEWDEVATGAAKTRLMVDGWNIRREIWADGKMSLAPERPKPVDPLAAHAPVEVEAFASSSEAPDRGPEKALDRNGETRWSSERKDVEWIGLDLGAKRKIAGLLLDWEAAYPKVYKIQISDTRKEWKDVVWVRDAQGGREYRKFPPVEARYIRMVAVERATQYGVSLWEMRAWLDGWADPIAPADAPQKPGWPEVPAKNRGLEKPQDAATLPKSNGPADAKPPATDLSGIRAAPEPAPFAPATEGRSVLRAGWKLNEAGKVKAKGDALSKPGFDAAAWHAAVVPGTVLGSLVRAGVVPDPYFNLNHMAIPESLCRQDWWYRVEFDAPAAWAGRPVVLQFDGVNYRAEVWLNGAKLGTVVGAFQRGRFDVAGRLVTGGRNALAVRISPPSNPGIPHEQSIAAGSGPNGGLMCLDGPTFFCTEGWDWIPGVRDRCAGIWQDVAFEATGPVRIDDLQVVTDLPLPDTSRADVFVLAELRNASSNAVKGTLRGRFESVEFSAPYSLRGGETRVVRFDPATHPQLAVKNPRLWWPNGQGSPELYTLALEAMAGGAASDSRKTRFGIREVSYEMSFHPGGGKPAVRREYRPTDVWRAGAVDPVDRERTSTFKGDKDVWLHTLRSGWETAPGLAPVGDTSTAPYLTLRVNGVRVHCRGGNWGMDDMLKQCSRAKLEPYVRLHREANVNMLRNWCGQSTSEALFDLCDEYGILVWNEFWLTTEGWNLDPKDEELLLANARDSVKRFRNHPSIVLWCGRNEGVPPEVSNRGLDQAVTGLDGTRLYQPNSRSVNLLHSGPWNYCPEGEYFTKHSRGFTTELGVPSAPEAATLRKFLAPADLWPPSDAWSYHDWHSQGGIGVAPFMQAITNAFGAPKDLEDFDRKAQALNYATHRAMFEGANSGLFKPCTGLLIWMTHCSWPSMVWQMYAWDYDTYGAFHGIQKASEPVHVQYNPVTHAVETVNRTREAVRGGKIEAALFAIDGARIDAKETAVDVAAGSVVEALKLPVPMDGVPQFLRLVWRDAKGDVLSDNFYWRAAKEDDLRAMASMPQAKVAASASVAQAGGERRVVVKLRNEGTVPAPLVRLAVIDAKTGERVLPAYWRGNYASLMPGEEQTVEAAVPGAKGAGLKVEVSGWNTPASTVEVAR